MPLILEDGREFSGTVAGTVTIDSPLVSLTEPYPSFENLTIRDLSRDQVIRFHRLSNLSIHLDDFVYLYKNEHVEVRGPPSPTLNLPFARDKITYIVDRVDYTILQYYAQSDIRVLMGHLEIVERDSLQCTLFASQVEEILPYLPLFGYISVYAKDDYSLYSAMRHPTIQFTGDRTPLLDYKDDFVYVESDVLTKPPFIWNPRRVEYMVTELYKDYYGQTERLLEFMEYMKTFESFRLYGQIPGIGSISWDGRIFKCEVCPYYNGKSYSGEIETTIRNRVSEVIVEHVTRPWEEMVLTTRNVALVRPALDSVYDRYVGSRWVFTISPGPQAIVNREYMKEIAKLMDLMVALRPPGRLRTRSQVHILSRDTIELVMRALMSSPQRIAREPAQ